MRTNRINPSPWGGKKWHKASSENTKLIKAVRKQHQARLFLQTSAVPWVGRLESPPARGCPGEQAGQVWLLLPKAPAAPLDTGELMCAERDRKAAVEKCSLHPWDPLGSLVTNRSCNAPVTLRRTTLTCSVNWPC